MALRLVQAHGVRRAHVTNFVTKQDYVFPKLPYDVINSVADVFKSITDANSDPLEHMKRHFFIKSLFSLNYLIVNTFNITTIHRIINDSIENGIKGSRIEYNLR